jgi:hypothetical protein
MQPLNDKGKFSVFTRLLCVCLILLGATLSHPPVADAAKKKRRRQPPPRIRTIFVDARNVFDPTVPGEDRWPFTWANDIHFTTHRMVILRELLVKPGDPADPEILAESERILRSLPFIKDATIRTIPVGYDQVDVLVQTNDSWTTQPQANYSTKGNQTTYSAGILEENMLGYGKAVSAFGTRDPDGSGEQFGYSDPQLFGSRAQLNSLFVNDPGGNQQHLTIARPFYSLETRSAAGVSWDHTLGRQKVINNGELTNEYDENHHSADAYVGRWINHDPLSVQRLSLHYRYSYDFFSPEATTLPGTLPINKNVSSPLLTWDWIQSDFIKEAFIEKAQRIEDINLGHQAEISAGYAPRVLGSTNNSIPLAATDSFGFQAVKSWFFLGSYGLVGQYNTANAHQDPAQLSNTLYFANLNLYAHLPVSFPLTAVAHTETGYVQNIDSQNQLQLGGDTGLRGFKVRAFTGNKSVLGNLETRFYYPREVLHLAYVGGVFFVDAGQVEPPGQAYVRQDFHSDVGIGLRIAPTRSTSGTVYRFDAAYAIGPIGDSKRVIFSVAAGQGFGPSANSYATFPNLPAPQSTSSP